MTGNEARVAEPTGESEPQRPGAQWSQRPELGWDGLVVGEIIARWREKEMRAGEGRGRKKGGQKKVCGHRDRI